MTTEPTPAPELVDELLVALRQSYADMGAVQAALDGGASASDVTLQPALDDLRPILAKYAKVEHRHV